MSDSRPPAETPTPPTSGANKRWEPPPPEELQALIPGYVIEKLLGKGGMGAVYKGVQENLERPVAIKIISNELDEADASYGERFKNEAKAMAKLNHPGIVAVFDYGQTSNGILYIVMEFVDGTDVSRMIAKAGRLQTAHAMAITAHVCDALAYAHERGIIHRDIKPANIMVGYDGVVKVADFGLAKMTQSADSGLTRSGMAMGTLHYMAPEALMLGSAVDHRADIYAVGVMLYQMLTGKIPQGMFKLPSLQIPGLDPRYDAIIAKAIMEDREARYQNVSEMRRDLDGILTQPVVKVEPEGTRAPAALPTQARPQRPGGQPYHPSQPEAPRQAGLAWLWVTLLILSVFGGIAWMVLGKPGGGSQGAQEDISTVGAAPVTSDPTQAAKEKPFENSLGMRFVSVPGTDVLFSIWHTRVQDWEKFEQSIRRSRKPDLAKVLGPTHPMTFISWDDAKAFCSWLTEEDRKLGRIASQQEYRLPTDAEWSVAVGLPKENGKSPFEKGELLSNKNTFPWGTSWPPPRGAGNYSVILNVDDFDKTSPVGSFAPNELGLYDMSGNLWQWCEDEHGEPGKEPGRVKRGGFYGNSAANFLRSSCRARGDLAAGRSSQSDGFRCVLAMSSSRTTLATSPAQPAAVSIAAGATLGTLDAKQATKEKPFENSLGMKFVPVPGTEVLFSIWDTRVQDWDKFEQTTTRPRRLGPNRTLGPTHPMTSISWTDAREFCAWLTEEDRKQGRIGSAQEYRLPSDAEWSIAVGLSDERGNTPYEKGMMSMAKPMYPWGTSWPPPKGAGNVGPDLGVDDYEATSPVGSFLPNSFGLYDMGTNVTQWCEDKYDESTKGDNRVLRGGNYGHGQSGGGNLRIGWRGHNLPTAAASIYGFRCVLTLLSSPTHETTAPGPGPVTPDPNLATKDKPFVNSLGMKFVPVPITGGATDTKQSGKRVFFCIHETRKRDYAVYATANSGGDTRWKYGATGDDHPASAVSCEEAKKFCEWLSKKESLSYRLPSDHEWSCAVGIGELEDVNGSAVSNRERTKGIYPWGTEWPPLKGAGNYDPSLGVDDFERTAPVMQFAPNKLGIYDLGGNVGEFCEVVRSSVDSPAQQFSFVARGGIFDGFVSPERGLLSSSRVSCPNPDNHNGSFGFRCVLVTDDVSASVSNGSSASDSKLASKEKPFENSLGMKFVPVPGTKPLFSIWDTRMQDYQAFAKETGREVKTAREYNLGAMYPITMVTWDDAKAFCVWLTERDRKSQIIGPSDIYRLPTDEEWSIAAGLQAEPDGTPEKKSGRISGYPWGTDKMPPKNYGNFMGENESPPLEGFKKMWTMGYQDGFERASPVGTFPPDANGLFDMMGNVYQYVEDWFDEQKTYRTLRGTTFWGYIKTTSQRTRRSRELAGDFNIGFRCVLELDANKDMDAAVVPKP